MAGLNKVMVIGNLGADPELRYSPQGAAFANFSVATTDVWFDKSTGEKQERTEWHKIVTFGKTAENCAKYLAKGRQVYVEGKLQTSSYEKDGQTHYITKIIADVIHFLGTKQDNAGFGQASGGGSSGGYQPPPRQQSSTNQNGVHQGSGYSGGGGYQGSGSAGYSPAASSQSTNSPRPSDSEMGGSMPPEDDIPF
ncbi:MAG: single-stranded DNA-binding protein [Desulfamplus sp.]|nr:single-stranded DNA-binding protein [Desulfamplus sp.]MBF0258263.1 single-stranded DNA-binding protein [Desulfamplus sp.]